MWLCFILEFGDIKSIDEMLALKLWDYEDACDWIRESIYSDSDYYNAKINIERFETIKYDSYESETNFYAEALLIIKADDKIGIDVKEDEPSDMEEIIESSLNVVSKIKVKMGERI